MAVNSGGESVPKFTYTGTYAIAKDGKNWKISFLSSGTFSTPRSLLVDLFAVGGGASAYRLGGTGIEGGGGGGYTTPVLAKTIAGGSNYEVTIGEGGGSSGVPSDGGASSFGSLITANGGSAPIGSRYGGNGGSGGGGSYANGGSDGSNGGEGDSEYNGTGQGTTTREFGEPDGDLYAGGGGGYQGTGGAGGGGNGYNGTVPGEAGVANTGGGAGSHGGTGGSGIVIIRNAR